MKDEPRPSTKTGALAAALTEGLFEQPLWTTFLKQLRRVTGASSAIITLRPPGRPIDDGLQLVSGAIEATIVSSLQATLTAPLAARERLSDGRVGSLDDLRQGDQWLSGPDSQLRAVKGLEDALLVRATEPNGVEAWLVVVRAMGRFGDDDRALLQDLAPIFRASLRMHVERERFRMAGNLAGDAIKRLQFGWILLDDEGYVLSASSFGQKILDGSGVLGKTASGRLTARPVELEAELLRQLHDLTRQPRGRPRAIALRSDPRLDMLLVPVGRNSLTPTANPAVIAYVHQDNWLASDRCAQLVDLFGLTASEARLALAICRGRSLAEAARDFDISESTARGYSKIIYAKTGTRGMPDLVRVIMGSVLVLAPEH